MTSLKKFVAILIVILVQFVFTSIPEAHAATSPTLTGASDYSVLGGAAVTNTGTTTTNGAVGVSPGSSITGQATLTAGGGIHVTDASADAAQADRLSAFGTLDAGENADANCISGYGFGAGNVDLAGRNLVPGVYCADTFTLTGTLNLSGTTGVWVFKAATTLITSPASSVTGGDACNVWWRIGSAATLDTTTSFLGNIVTDDDGDTTALKTGATLNGRVLGGTGQTVTLAGNTISLSCSAAAAAAAAAAASSTLTAAGASSSYCPPLSSQIVVPNIIESRRVDADSIFISWAPYSGTNLFNVQYGLTNGSWSYSTNVTGFSTTINSLPANQPIWVRVAASNNCMVGGYGSPMLVGGPMLPNTGFAPRDSNIPWYIPANIFTEISYLFSFAH